MRLAQEALPLWRRLEAESGEPLLDLTGLVNLPLDLDRLTAALDGTDTAYELLTAAEVEHRFDLATNCCKAVFQPDAGVVFADRAARALAAGLDVREHVRVDALTPNGVETDAGAIEADTVVVAAGAWARTLLRGAGIDLPVVPTRETVSYFRLASGGAVPSVIDYANRETYALTAGDGVLKVGVHRTGPPTDPPDEGEPDPEIVAVATEWAGRSFRLAQPDPVRVETCIYTNTADAGFVLERHGRIVVCSACSGHGFKFAPAVGARVAALASMS